MNDKLLLDENISPWVAARLCNEDGLDACGVRDRLALASMGSRPDMVNCVMRIDADGAVAMEDVPAG